MPNFRMSEVAALLGVSDDTVRRWAEAGKLPAERDQFGRFVVNGSDLAEFARSAATAPEPGRITGESARNRFTGIVTRVVCDGVMAQVEMQCGPFRVVSLMSAEAVNELGLAVGVRAVASIKATQVVVGIPERHARS